MAVRITNHPIAGRVRWSPRGDGTIEILDGWAERNIVVVDVPELKGAPTYGGTFNGKVRWFKGATEQLRSAWAEVGSRGLTDRVVFWSGSFVPRMVRGSLKTPSNHTFGTAFDINHQWNGLGVFPPIAGQKGSVRELVPIFQKHGFFWGGDYQKRKDGMHFEIERLGPPASGEADRSVEVFVGGMQQAIPALLLENRTWVGARAMATALGGSIGKVTSNPLTVEVKGKQTKALECKLLGGVGYALFAELIPLFGNSWTFDNAVPRLAIEK